MNLEEVITNLILCFEEQYDECPFCHIKSGDRENIHDVDICPIAYLFVSILFYRDFKKNKK